MTNRYCTLLLVYSRTLWNQSVLGLYMFHVEHNYGQFLHLRWLRAQFHEPLYVPRSFASDPWQERPSDIVSTMVDSPVLRQQLFACMHFSSHSARNHRGHPVLQTPSCILWIKGIGFADGTRMSASDCHPHRFGGGWSAANRRLMEMRPKESQITYQWWPP